MTRRKPPPPTPWRPATHRGRLCGLLLGLLAVLAAPGLAQTPEPAAQEATGSGPYRPSRDDLVLERLPPGDRDPRLAALRTAAAEDPADPALAARLASHFIALGHQDGDPRYNGYAQAALARWWDEPAPPPEILLLRATLRQNRHDFDGALEDLDRLLATDRQNAQAWMTRAVILQVRGRPDAAVESCRPLLSLTEPLAATACAATAASLGGRAATSYDTLKRVLEAGETGGQAAPTEADAELRRWAHTSLAEIAERLGRGEAAEGHYRDALQLTGDEGGRDLYLLAAYADFLLDQDRPREVLDLLAGETRSDNLLLRLALAEGRLAAEEAAAGSGRLLGPHRARLASYRADLEARFADARRRGETTHLGSEARFVLHLEDQPRQALELALANWQAQREPIDARLVLEAALAAGEPAAARPVLEWRRESGLEDVRLDALTIQLEEAEAGAEEAP